MRKGYAGRLLAAAAHSLLSGQDESPADVSQELFDRG